MGKITDTCTNKYIAIESNRKCVVSVASGGVRVGVGIRAWISSLVGGQWFRENLSKEVPVALVVTV